jgi:tyrosyl-tRNA synthetase
MAHGAEAAEAAAETARRTFGEGSAGDELPSIEVDRADLARGLQAIELLHRSGLASSKSEARRLIKGGGARVNGEALTDDAAILTLAQVTAEGYIKLSAGRKKHALVRPR